MSLDDVCWNISSVFIVITLGVIAIQTRRNRRDKTIKETK